MTSANIVKRYKIYFCLQTLELYNLPDVHFKIKTMCPMDARKADD